VRIRVPASFLRAAEPWSLCAEIGLHYASEAVGVIVTFWMAVASHRPGGFVGDGTDDLLNDFAGYYRVKRSSKRYRFAAWARKHLLDADGYVRDWDRIYPLVVRRDEAQRTERSKVNPRLRSEVLERDGFRCRRCGSGVDHGPLVVDHVHPISRGGKTEMGNLQTLCHLCNTGKAARLPTPHDLKVVNGGLD
jgi:5-methylcytosine-specific restriction endonuclease McrA